MNTQRQTRQVDFKKLIKKLPYLLMRFRRTSSYIFMFCGLKYERISVKGIPLMGFRRFHGSDTISQRILMRDNSFIKRV